LSAPQIRTHFTILKSRENFAKQLASLAYQLFIPIAEEKMIEVLTTTEVINS